MLLNKRHLSIFFLWIRHLSSICFLFLSQSIFYFEDTGNYTAFYWSINWPTEICEKHLLHMHFHSEKHCHLFHTHSAKRENAWKSLYFGGRITQIVSIHLSYGHLRYAFSNLEHLSHSVHTLSKDYVDWSLLSHFFILTTTLLL